MKILSRNFLPLLVVAIAVTACTFEKRQYMSGYHVDFKHKTVAQTAQTGPEKIQPLKTTTPSVDKVEQVVTLSTPVYAAPPDANTITPKKPVVNKSGVTSTTTESSDNNTLVRSTKVESKQERKSGKKNSSGPDKGLLIVLAILIPWLAVGLVTDWEVKPVVINLLLCLTCIGGIIHAIIVVNDRA
ncbi:MAG: YqaE/Pmp3 family membrane protein [Bacteroidia bacterium]|nr:YqaE/Pmp3 family membrane protein [Bacteroidia bacterium]